MVDSAAEPRCPERRLDRTTIVAHRLFAIPELLASIFKFLSTQDRYACAQVNYMWWKEAIRFLWLNCGGEASLHVRDLAALAEYPEHLQTYANCIESLRFEEMDKGRKDLIPIDGKEFYHVFAHTEFPQLRLLLLSPLDCSEPISHYF